jgi:hypothetical protein
MVQMVCFIGRNLLDHKVQLVQLVLKDQAVLQVLKVLKVQLVLKAPLLLFLAHKVLKE